MVLTVHKIQLKSNPVVKCLLKVNNSHMFNMFKNNNRNTGARREIVFLDNYNSNFYALLLICFTWNSIYDTMIWFFCLFFVFCFVLFYFVWGGHLKLFLTLNIFRTLFLLVLLLLTLSMQLLAGKILCLQTIVWLDKITSLNIFSSYILQAISKYL